MLFALSKLTQPYLNDIARKSLFFVFAKVFFDGYFSSREVLELTVTDLS